eukprot:sb/3467296/
MQRATFKNAVKLKATKMVLCIKRAKMNPIPASTIGGSATQLQIISRLNSASDKVNQDMKRTSLIDENEKNNGLQCKIKGCLVWRSSEKDLYQHIRDDHPDRKHFCDVCPMAFKQDWYLTQHHLAHSGYKPHKCKECEKCFFQKNNLHKHHILVHRKSVSDSVTCRVDNCGVRLPKSELYKHIETAHPKKNFQCDICPMSFKNSKQLNQHLRAHSGIKPFKCEVCEMKFTQRSNYKRHKRTHTDERPFNCEVCGKKFNRKSNLQLHIRTHTGEKPFPCSKCGKSFSQDSAKRLHEFNCPGNKH